MTIGGWIAFGFFAALFIGGGVFFLVDCITVQGKILSAVIAVLLTIGLLAGLLWYYGNTASGKRAMVDQKSELNNGIERTITVYTADGKVIAQYTGEIDIEGNDGGYVLFDYNGKRYTYYNCFVESIAEIGE